MNWLHWYCIRQYIRNSIWVLPFVGMVIAMAAVRVSYKIDDVAGWKLQYDPEAAKIVLGMLASSIFTFIVYVASALLLAVQLASALLTPRIIGIVFRDQVTRLSLTAFVVTFIFLCGCLVRIRTTVPLLTGSIAALGCLASLLIFLNLIDHVGKSLRPSGTLQSIAKRGHQVINSVYPRRLDQTSSATRELPGDFSGQSVHTILSSGNGVLLAFDVHGLVSLARQNGCLIEMVPEVGDYIAVGQPLFRIYGGTKAPSASAIHSYVALGKERTMEQDPCFAFRIIVDIAIKGLSPAINDPTTAVLAIDQIHHLLGNVGNRFLDEGRRCDAEGTLRLIYPTPDWEDFVYLAVTEIRQFGGQSIQTARRLRAMLENLIQTLPQVRVAMLEQELNLLKKSTQRLFPELEDQMLADIGDIQGVGGKHEPNSVQREVESIKEYIVNASSE